VGVNDTACGRRGAAPVGTREYAW